MTRTKRRYVFLPALVALTLFFRLALNAQCPQIEAIMIDACGTEFLNEFVIIRSGSGFNTSDIELDYDINNNILSGQNNDINTNNGNFPGDDVPCGLTTGNPAAFTGCSNLIAVGPGVDIPANAIVVLQTSAGSTNSAYNFASLCGAGQCVYVISSACTRTAGGFTNGFAAGTRVTNFSIAGTCLQTITYNLALTGGGNGAYYLPLTNVYGNGGCVAPPITGPSLMPPVINPLPNVTVCGDYTLPAITGTNLTPNVAYYTGTNGTGTQYQPGDIISSTTTLYIFDQNGPVGCTDQEQFTVTISAPPTVNQPADVTVCAGQNVNVALTGAPAGVVFNWTNDNTAVGLAASGTGNINFPSANVTQLEIALITVTPTQGSCTGTPVTFTITVNPRPTVDDPPNQTVCGGTQVDVLFTGSGTTPTYNWTNNTPAIGLAASGSGDISFTANNVSSPLTGTITVTASENGCTGPPQTFTITVNPTPTVNQPANVTACAGQTVSVNFTGSAGATFNWANDNPAIGLAASGSGNISFPAALVANQEVATITVTPVNATTSCSGTPVTFTITINPGPTVNDPGDQTVCAGSFVSIPLNSPTNPVLNWTNSNTAIGLPASGSGDINFTAANVATAQTGTLTVTPVENGCTGVPQTFTITVNPVPFVTQPNNQTVCGGEVITVNFTGTTGATFNWTNDNPAIGLDPSGSGNILFATNNPAIQEIATITVTPNNGLCDGIPRTFTLTVNPAPTVNPPANLTVCGGQPVSVTFTSPNNPTYAWTNSNTLIGLPASGNGNISYTAPNVTANQTGTITVTPSQAGCTGTPETFAITISPAPTINQPGNIAICAGQSIVINFSGSAGATFNWTNSNTAIGLAASGSGNINLTAAPVLTQQVGTITVTPFNGGCNGLPVSFTITINPLPTVSQPANVSVCNGDPVAVNFTGSANATFTWTNNNPAIGLGASGNGNISFTAAPVSTTQVATITVIPHAGTCNGNPVTFTITVSPGASVDNPGNQTACGGGQVTVNFTGTGNPTFSWTNNNPAIGLGASGNGNISFTAANVTATETATITVTPSGAGCAGTPQTFTVTVSPGVSVNNPGNQLACAGDTVSIVFTGTGNPAISWTNNNPLIGLGASGNGNIGFTAANVTAPETATITLTASGAGCAPTNQIFSITINPKDSISNPGNQSVCAGDSVHVLFTGTGNPAVSWTNDNPAIGLPATGTGNLHFISANVTAPETSTITVTPQVTGAYAYITNFGSDNVSVIDVATNTVVATITVGDVPEGVCVSPDGSRVYVTNNFGNTVSVINAATNTVVATIPVGNGPLGLSVSPDGSRVYVANTLSNTVSVIDAATNTVIATIPGINQPYGVWAHPDGTRVYVASFGSGNVSVIDVATNTVAATIPVGNGPYGICISPDGSRVYVSNEFSNDVSVIDAATNTVVATIPVGTTPIGVSISPDGSRVYVVNEFSNTVSVIDAATNTVVATVPVGLGPLGLSASPDGKWVYVANFVSGTVSVIDAASNTVVATVTVGTAPTAFGNFITAASGCAGSPQTFTITVNPAPTLTQPNNTTACGNQTVNVLFTPSAGAMVNWTNSNPAIGLPANGSGNLSFIAANVATPQTATITATPVLDSCAGGAQNFTITINPSAMGSVNGALLLCSGDSTTLTASGGVQYEWSTADTTSAITVVPAVTTTYTVIITNAFGCAAAVAPTVNVNPSPVAAISGNTVLCAGDSTTLTASGGLNYTWNTAASSPAITVSPDSMTTYTVTVTNVATCTATASAAITVHPSDSITISMLSCNPVDTGTVVQSLQNAFGCDSVVTTVTVLAPTDTVNLTVFTCDPTGAGTFIQQLSNQFGCDSTVTTTVIFDPAAIDTTLITATTCDPTQAGTVQVSLPGADGCDSLVITTTTLLPSDTVNLTASTCDPAQAGTVTQNLTNQFGCDSTVITTTALLPSDTVHLTQFTCDPNSAGAFTQTLTNQSGCDSTVTTTVIFDPAAIDTTLLSATTCDPNQAGTVVQNLINQFGCDSLVITTTTLLPSDTVNLTQFTCDPNSAGTFIQTLTNQSGCDSTVTTTVIFDPAAIDTTLITATTCDPNQAGTAQVLLTGAGGCDSLVITTTTLLPSDTVNLAVTTCDLNGAGVFTQTLSNQFGCDSVVIRTVTFTPGDTVNLNQTTCNPSQAGVFMQHFNNQAGCDSLVVTTVTLLPSDTVNLTVATCDSSSAGVFTQVLTNQFGCDSTIITTSIFDPSLIDITVLNDFTCDPSQAGTTQTLLIGTDGCDSLVVLTLDLLPSDTITVTSFTCDPNTAGTFIQVLQNQYGCDSVLISEVIFDPLPCAPVIALGSTPVSCGSVPDGSITVQVQNGQVPLQYSWAGSGGNTGSGQITDITTPLVIQNLPAGTYTVTVTDPVSGATATATATVGGAPVLTVTATVQTNFNGFAVSCAGAADGAAAGTAGGGTPPFQFGWSNGDLNPVLDSIGAGTYTLTITDANGCTALASATLNAPPPLTFALSVDRPDCGDSLVDASITAAGGIVPYLIIVDGNAISGTMPSLGSGTHVVVLSDANGCTADSTVALNLPPVPSIALPPDTTVVLGHTVRIEALTNLSTWDLLDWKPLPDTACAGCLVQEWTPFQSEIITVTIQDTFGCTASAVIRVLVDRITELYIPNAFSPNGDGKNDAWQVNAGLSVAEIQEVRVFDRWGNLQYEWNNPLAPNSWPGWDGITRGKKADVGVYVYYLKVKLADGTTSVIKGDVTILER